MRIGLDVMGGDHVPHAPIAGVKTVLPQLAADVTLVLVGPEATVRAEMQAQNLEDPRIEVVHAEHVIGMDEHPAKAFMAKPNSSIAVGLNLVKEGKLDAFASAGNTGAVMVASVLTLGNIPGIQRPMVAALFPSTGGYSLLCDVGLNADCKPDQLAQFGEIGAVYVREVMKVPQPRVALMNVGEEKSKGNQLAQQTYPLLAESKRIHFIGNAEGRDLLFNHADVYVCDGFVGNILLKFGESLYKYFKGKTEEAERFNYENVGGLPILGINGNVMVAHGSSGPLAFHNFILRAVDVVSSDLVGKLTATFAA